MPRKLGLVASIVSLALTLPSTPSLLSPAFAVGNCAPTDKINNTTADDARKRMEEAGYTQVHDLRKGCDNAWHATAMKDGVQVFVVWNKEGQVLTEGD